MSDPLEGPIPDAETIALHAEVRELRNRVSILECRINSLAVRRNQDDPAIRFADHQNKVTTIQLVIGAVVAVVFLLMYLSSR